MQQELLHSFNNIACNQLRSDHVWPWKHSQSESSSAPESSAKRVASNVAEHAALPTGSCRIEVTLRSQSKAALNDPGAQTTYSRDAKELHGSAIKQDGLVHEDDDESSVKVANPLQQDSLEAPEDFNAGATVSRDNDDKQSREQVAVEHRSGLEGDDDDHYISSTAQNMTSFMIGNA